METCRNQREQQFIQNNRVQRITGVLPEVSTTAFFPKIFATFGSGGSASLAAEIQCGCRHGSKQLLASVLQSCIETIFFGGTVKAPRLDIAFFAITVRGCAEQWL